MAAFDFQSLGLDRLSQNIKRAVTNPTGTLTTGDITKGELVSVTFSGSLEETVTVSPRRSGAIMLDIALDGIGEIYYGIIDTTLTVTLNNNNTGTIKFWVF